MISLNHRIGTNPKDGSPITVATLLRLFATEFPGGFNTYKGEKFLRRERDSIHVEKQGDTYAFYKKLAEAGHLSRTKVNGSGKGARYLYRVKLPQHDESSSSPQTQLFLTYAAYRGTLEMEQVIVGDKRFVRSMAQIRERDPDFYRRLGGAYLDLLLE